MSPTTAAAALLAVVGIAALALPPAVALLAALALLVATLVDAVFARRLPRVSRRVADVLSRGVPDDYEARIRDGEGAGPVTIRQATPADVELETATGGSRQGGLTTRITARRRGRHVLPPVSARHTGPLGLASRTAEVTGEAEVLVYPDLPAARRAAVAARMSRYRDPGFRSRGPLGLGTEFERVREYLPDDDIRQVNWRATARLGRPMSNDFRIEEDRDLICVIDCGRLMGAPIGNVTRLDACLDALAAVAAVADDVRDRIGVLAFDSSIRKWIAPLRQGGPIVVRELFDLEPSGEQSDFARAFHSLETEKRAFVLLFTDLLEETAARPLIEAMPVLARKHAVAVATIADPGLSEPLREEPADGLGVARQAVALEVLDARRRAGAALAGSGAEVVDAPPEKLAGACVGAYLRAKARARL